MGLQHNPELWPWFVTYATNALNHRLNNRTHNIPIESYRKRLGIEKPSSPIFSFNDVVTFIYTNEPVANET